MSKNTLSGFLDGLKNLISQTEAATEETPVEAAEQMPEEMTAATEAEIAAAVKMLTDLGYKVEAPEMETETVEVELPVEAGNKEDKPMMTAEAVEAMVAAKVEAALKAAKAAKPVTQAAAKPAPTTAEAKKQEIANKVGKAFDSLANQMKNN